MSGISHSWNGTVLTITSDSGTSSADLKGEKGDDGVRGAQGASGTVVNIDSSLSKTGQAADAKATGDKINALQPTSQIISGSTKPITSGAVYNLKEEITNVLYTESYVPNDYIDSILLYKIGNVVQMQFGKMTKDVTNLTTTTLIGVLPDRFKPAVNTQRIIPVSLSNQMMYISITATGNIYIRIYGTLITGTQLYTGITYIS